jgi:DNA-nicking Smr family endonuclease
MPLRDEDKTLWQQAMKDVQPLISSHVSCPPPSIPKILPKLHTAHHTWDLHGMTLSEAHQLAVSKIHNNTEFNSMLFITGKSGSIQQEFLHWLQGCKGVRKVVPLAGGGSFRVYFKKT